MNKMFGVFTKYSRSYSFLMLIVLCLSLVLTACGDVEPMPSYGNMPDKVFGNAGNGDMIRETMTLAFGAGVVNVVTTAKAVPSPILPGDVRLVHPGSTFNGLVNAVKGVQGTLRFQKDGNYLLAWIMQGEGSAFAVLQNSKMSVQNFFWTWGGKAMLVNTLTWEEFQKALLDNGWVKIAPSAISAAFIEELTLASAGLAVISRGLPNLIILPMGLFTTPLNVIPSSINQ